MHTHCRLWAARTARSVLNSERAESSDVLIPRRCGGRVFVGRGNRRQVHAFSKIQMIRLLSMCLDGHYGVVQAFACRQLPEEHYKQLIPKSDLADSLVAVIFFDNIIKLRLRKKFCQLTKNVLALIHSVL